MFLGVRGKVQDYQQKEGITSFLLVFSENPLNDFVQLPKEYEELHYSNLICGVIRGALNQIQIEAVCTFEQDGLKVLKGVQHSQILVQMQKEKK